MQDLVFANVLQVEHLSPKSPFPVGVGLYEVQEYLTTGKLVVHTPSRDGVDGTQRREFKPSHFWPAEAPPNEQAVKGTGQANEAPAPIPEETLGGSTAQSLDKQLALHDQPTAVRASTGSLPGDGKAQDGKLSTGEGAVSEAI